MANLPKIDTSQVPSIEAGELIQTQQLKSKNLWADSWQAPAAIVAGGIDTTVSSLANITDFTGLTNFDLSDGIMPSGWDGYQRNKEAWQATSDIASLFLVAGAATKAIRTGGALATFSKNKGMSSTAMHRVFANRNAVKQLDDEISDVLNTSAEAIGSSGLTAAGLTDDVVPWTSLNGAKMSTEAARRKSLGMRVDAAVKETIASEVAIAAVMNDSDLLFPEDGSLGDYLMTAGLAGGAVAGIDRVVGSRIHRKMLAQAMKNSSAEAAAVRQGAPVMDTASIAVGDRWTVTSALGEEMSRADQMLNSLDNVKNAQAAELMRGSAVRVKQENQRQITDVLKQQRADSTVSGVSVSGSKSDLPDSGAELVQTWIEKDQRRNIGIVSLEDTAVNSRYGKAIEKAHNSVNTALKSGDVSKVEQARENLKHLESHNTGVIEADGSLNLHTSRKVPYQEANPGGKTTLRYGSKRKSTFKLNDPKSPNVEFTAGGQVLRKAGKSNMPILDGARLTFDETTSLYKAASIGLADFSMTGFGKAFAENFTGELDTLPVHILDSLAAGKFEFSKAGTINSQKLAELQTQIATGEVQLASFKHKFQQFAAHANENAHDLSKRLNMKLVDEEGLENELANALRMLGKGDVKSLDAHMQGQSLKDIAKSLAALSGDTKNTNKILAQMGGGNMLDLHTQATPVGFVRKQLDGASDSDVSIASIAQARRDLRLSEMSNSLNDMTTAVMRSVKELGEVVEAAMDVGSLARDGLIESAGVGAGFARNFSQTTQRFREMPSIQHAHTVQQHITRATDKIAAEYIEPVAVKYAKVVQNNNVEVLAAHSDYSSIIKAGGELKEDAIAPGLNQLDASKPSVRALVENAFGKSVEDLVGADGALYVFDRAEALRGNYKPLHFSDESADLINDFIGVSYSQLDMANEYARLGGRALVRRKKGHLPTVNFADRQMRYIADERGKVVGYVQAKTGREAERLRDQMLAVHNANGKNYIKTSDSQVKGWVNSRDGNRFASLTNYSDPLMQTGGTKGRNMDVTRDLSGDVGKDQLISMREGFSGLKDKAIYTAFEPFILKNRQLNNIGDATSFGDLRRKGNKRRFFSANEEWENVLFGRAGRPEGSVAQEAENTIVPWFEELFEIGNETLLGIKERAFGAKKRSAAMEKLVGSGYTPMSNAAEALLKIDKSTSNKALASSLQSANKATAEVFLKFANVAHPILNMLSVATTLPAVSNMLTRRKNESVQNWKDRVGAWSDFMDVDSVATVSSTKIMTQGMEFFHSSAGKEMLEEAAQHGFITSNMLEDMNKAIFSTPTKASEIGGYIKKYGDFINGPINAAMRKAGKEPSADTISERSETFVRGLFHSIGYQFAQQHMPNATPMMKHNFGQYFANQNIADFSPNIRGQAFRGVSGIPLGLFQSFGINYLQRVFKMVENKDAKQAAIQAATQSLVFGAEGLPGFPALNSLFMNAENRGGENDGTLTDRIYKAYGKENADVLMSGAVSNLPRLFGADDGLNFYTSGDANPRGVFSMPSVSLAKQMSQMAGKIMSSEAENLKLTAEGAAFGNNRTAEILASYVPIRGVRSMMELALGYSTDRAGDLISNDTRSGMTLVSRLLGTRTVDEVRKRSAMWKNRVDMQHRRARLTQIGRAFTAKVRQEAGNLAGKSADDVQIDEKEFEAYLARWAAEGGRMDTAQTAFNRMLDKAFTPEDLREMNKYVASDGTLKGGDVYQFMMERMVQYGYHEKGLTE